MKVINVETLRKNTDKHIDVLIAHQCEIRNHWAGKWNTGEGNSFLYARNMEMAQDCIDFLTMLKRGTSCDGCEVIKKAAYRSWRHFRRFR